MSSAIGKTRLSVALDLRDPFSYLALGPTLAFAEQTGVAIDWLPIRAHTLVAPSSPSPDDDRGTRHRRARAQMVAREIAIYSAAQGIEIASPYRDGSAEAVHAAWLWLLDVGASQFHPFLEAVFEEYWAGDLDPTCYDAVAQLVERLGLDAVAFRQWAEAEGPEAVQSAATQLAETGVLQAPAYQIEGEVFYGRQHLPFIGWILGGRSGDGPI